MEHIMSEHKKRPIWEKIVVFSVLSLIMSVGFVFFKEDTKVQNEQALIYQLKTLRAAVQVHLKMYNEKPRNLSSLIQKLKDGSNTVKLDWKSFKMTNKGQLFDPFNNPYEYDRETGWIRSSTRGYHEW